MENEITEKVPETPENRDDQAAENTFDSAAGQILTGLAIATFTLNFAYLNLILPAIGVILMYFGMKKLRRTGTYFRWGYRLSILELAVFLFNCWWSATIYASLDGMAFQLITNGFSLAGSLLKAGIAILLCLGVGEVCAANEKTPNEKTPNEKTPKTGALWFLILLMIGLMLAAPFGGLWSAVPFAGIIVLLLFIIDYIALYRMWKSWTELKIGAAKAESRISQGRFFAAYIILLAAGILSCCFAFSRYPMDWTAENSGSTGNTENPENSGETDGSEEESRVLIDRLADLGAPEDILDDLSAEELDLLKDAVDVEFLEDAEPVDSEIQGLHMSHLCFCLNEEKTEYAILHYFRWDDDAKLCGTDAVDIDTDGESVYWNLADGPTGKLLYENGDTTYAGSWQDLKTGHQTADESEDFFLFTDDSYHIKGGFSFKNGWENRRGYLLYAISYYDPYAEAEAIPLFDSSVRYSHQTSLLQYPYEKTVDAENAFDALSNGFTIKPFIYESYDYIGFKDGQE